MTFSFVLLFTNQNSHNAEDKMTVVLAELHLFSSIAFELNNILISIFIRNLTTHTNMWTKFLLILPDLSLILIGITVTELSTLTTVYCCVSASLSVVVEPPSPPLDNIRVMVIVWRLRGNIIRTAPCCVV